MKKICLVLSLIGCLVCFVGCNKDEMKNDNSMVDNNESQQQEVVNGEKENEKDEIQNSSIWISKLDNEKEWIYDADYEKGVSGDSYSTEFNETYNVNDIVVPFINIDSQDATQANNEIKMVFDSAIETFNNGIKDGLSYVDECNYKSYNNDDKLSVVLTFGEGATDVVHPNYYTYNFELKTGKSLSYEEIYNLAGFTSGDIDMKVENAIRTVCQSDESLYNVNDSINNYKNSISDNTLKYYLANNNELNIVVELSVNAGNGLKTTILTIK